MHSLSALFPPPLEAAFLGLDSLWGSIQTEGHGAGSSCFESTLEGSGLALTIPNDRHLARDWEVLLNLKGKPPSAMQESVLPAPMGQDPGWQQRPGLSPQVPVLLGGRPSHAATPVVNTTCRRQLRKWAARGGGGVCVWMEAGKPGPPRSALIPLVPVSPRPSDATRLVQAAAGNQGHDPPLNLPSNWEGQLYP